MTNKCDGSHATDSDRIRDFEVAVSEIGSAIANDLGELLGQTELQTMVYAHPHQQLRFCVLIERTMEIVILQQKTDWAAFVLGRDAIRRRYVN